MSNLKLKLRDASVSDAARILEIYSPFITDSFTSFEYNVPTEDEMKKRMESVMEHFPWLVCETDDDSRTIAGYAYGCKHRVREGYQWISETGIYLAPEFRGQGIGKLLYVKLCEILKMQGFVYALGGIAGENKASTEFHKSLGFTTVVSEWENCGNKFGKWCKVTWYAKTLNELVDNPEKPRPYSEIKEKISLN